MNATDQQGPLQYQAAADTSADRLDEKANDDLL